eukprot:6908131-Prymnesium_polylepis.1
MLKKTCSNLFSNSFSRKQGCDQGSLCSDAGSFKVKCPGEGLDPGSLRSDQGSFKVKCTSQGSGFSVPAAEAALAP